MLLVVSKPAINPNIFGSVNNLHTDETLHTDLIDVLIEFWRLWNMKTITKMKTLSSVLLMFIGMFKWIINIICRIFMIFLSFSMISQFSHSFESNKKIKKFMHNDVIVIAILLLLIKLEYKWKNLSFSFI